MRIQLINPNTNLNMTLAMGRAAQAVARPGNQIIACCPDAGPESIEGHFDEAIAAVGVLEEIRKGVAEGYDAHIIACFGDPGLLAARELARAPVIGIAEAAFHIASLICTRFAVVTTLTRTRIIAQHLLRNYGMTEHCTSVRCVDIAVLELETMGEDLLVERIAEQALHARDHEGAGAIVLGCGGMADLPARVSERVGLPVIDGVAAAVKLAETLGELGLSTSKKGDLAYPLAKRFSGRFAHFSSAP